MLEDFADDLKLVDDGDDAHRIPALRSLQVLTGLWLMRILNISYGSFWFVSVISLFLFVAIWFLPVVGI